jgi:hypothetical protein
MKVINHGTHWDTRAVKRLCLAVAKHELLTPAEIARKRVHLKWRRIAGRGLLGKAWFNSDVITLYLERDTLDPVLYAKVIAHEYAHNQGVRHRQMAESYEWKEGWRETWGWAATYTVPRKARKDVPVLSRSDIVAKKLTHAQGLLENWEKKERAAARHARNWRVRVKYYTRKLEAAMKGETDGN